MFKEEQKSLDQAIMTLAQRKTTRTAEVGAAGTLTVDKFVNGLYHQVDGGTPGTKTTPTAAEIVAGIRGCVVGTSFEFSVYNADGADTLTVGAGDSVTIAGTATIAAGKFRKFYGVVTNVDTPAVHLYAGPST